MKIFNTDRKLLVLLLDSSLYQNGLSKCSKKSEKVQTLQNKSI